MKRSDGYTLCAAILWITLATAGIYYKTLFRTDGLYPWASDGLSHVMKAAYLQDELSQGVIYPEFFPDWYFGAQVLRYYPPLPYYALVTLGEGLGIPLPNATAWLIALCAWFGGLSWLLYRRWIGWLPATLGGTLFLMLPDNLRVAFAEGNYPRVLTTALIPLLVYLALRALEDDAPLWTQAGLVLGMTVTVLNHAMLSAIHAVAITLLVFGLWLGKKTTIWRALLVPVCLGTGIMLAGWWLLPSLTGGITELDTSYWARITYPWRELLNPFLRMHNIEVLYIGATLMLLPLAGLLWRRGRNAATVSLTLVGAFGVLINTRGFNGLYNALPLSSLMMPYRFLGIASFMLLLALMWQAHESGIPWLAGALFVLIALDSAPSLRLAHLRPPSEQQMQVSNLLAQLPGWRVATLDQGRLGPAPSYFLTAVGGREQVYGWSYYGARTATTISALEDGLIYARDAYVFDRLSLFGTDDVLLLKSLEIAPALSARLEAAGYRSVFDDGSVVLYHRDGGARAFAVQWRILGIGRGARNFSYLFPQIISGTSPYVDDYDQETLTRYPVVVLSGFTWHDLAQAETLVRQAAQAGVRFVVDFTQTREDSVSRIVRFLDVWGERIVLPPDEPILARGPSGEYALAPFGEPNALWHTYTPQGLQNTDLTYTYLGENATLTGYNTYGSGQVWFIGGNLPYHAIGNHDPQAIRLLSSLLDTPPDTPNTATPVPLERYQTSHTGYRFDYTLPQAAWLFFPAAFHEGMTVEVDGMPVQVKSFENLLAFQAPAGTHHVIIALHHTRIYQMGLAVSLAALVIFGLLPGLHALEVRKR
ncbi:MAG: 6-pyruvoyl-tetrahydropterin synthase-related protein [Anaerolineales bacterium]